ncbi:MAG: type III secretion system export apparatus subunit SctT [Duodenibacillus sp.]|nr:type III secretion system export apparatus subunit SctT [Duodenibacillus sp.]
MPELFEALGVEEHLLAFLLGSTRLTMFAMIAPFMGASVMGTTVRMAVVTALYMAIHPVVLAQMPPPPSDAEGFFLLFGLLVKELFVGFLLGWLAGMAFWAMESAGFFIDNQRGAGQATETDPLTGETSSPTGSFLFQSLCYAFFASGSFAACLMVVYGTYEIWPPTEWIPASFFNKHGAALFFGQAMAKLAASFVLLSAPVVVACLFTDVALGLINRFASQLNVYILAMPIKSALASFLLIFYFAILMTDAPERFTAFGLDVKMLRAFWP